MSKFKKVLSVVLVVAMVAAISIAGTMAYLTDDDSQVNTFTNGNVKIDLWEDFGDNDEEGIEHLLPTTGKNEDGSQINGVNKEVYVTNTGSEDAYVRVHIAIPAILDDATDASQNILHFNYNAENAGIGLWDWSKTTGEDYTGDWNVYTATIDDIVYNVYVVTYESALAPGETTVDAIWQVYMDSSVTNEKIAEINETLGSEWKILVAAEAGQAGGYDDAYTALNTQFGTPGEYAIADWDLREDVVWGKITDKVGIITNAEELAAALQNGGNYIFGNDITTDDVGQSVADGVTVNLDLDGYELDCGFIENSGNVTITGGTITAGSATNYSNISLAGSVTVYNDVKIDSAGGGIGAAGGAKVTFNSGSVAVNTASTSGRYLFYAEGEGTEITINDGEFADFTKTSQNQKRAYIYAGAGTTVYVNGGTFGKASTRSGYTDGILGDGTVIIKGGTFGFDPSKWVADGYQAVQSGSTWTVTAK